MLPWHRQNSIAERGGTGTMTAMLRTELDALYDDILESRRLLAHPFYRRWEAGTLEPGELASYAGQYRHFEAALPLVLESIAGDLPDGPARRLVEANLEDERWVREELLPRFAFAGIRWGAFVAPSNQLAAVILADITKNPPTGAGERKQFVDIDEAKRWLLSTRVGEASLSDS